MKNYNTKDDNCTKNIGSILFLLDYLVCDIHAGWKTNTNM